MLSWSPQLVAVDTCQLLIIMADSKLTKAVKILLVCKYRCIWQCLLTRALIMALNTASKET